MQVIEARVSERPAGPCQRFHRAGAWREWSYDETFTRAKAVAGGLVSLGIGVGDRVAIFSENCPEWVLADLGGILAGAIVVTVYAGLTAEEAAYIVAHSGSRIVFAENAAQAAKLLSVRDTLPELEQIVLLDNSTGGDAIKMSISELEALARPESIAERLERTRRLTPDDPLTLVYTSGTTGTPKGAVLTHGNIVRTVKASLEALDEDLNIEVALRVLPLAHVLERLVGHFAVLSFGAAVAQIRSMETFSEDVRAIRPDFMALVPRVYEKAYAAINARMHRERPLTQMIFRWAVKTGTERSILLEQGRPVPWALRWKYRIADRLVFQRIRAGLGGRTRFLGSGGAPLSTEIARFFHAAGMLILEAWGATETTAPATSNTSKAYRFGSVGRPLPGVEVKVADDGELLVRGINVFKEYYKDSQATADAFDPEGFYRSGDIGRIDEQGFVYITDRKKEIIITAAGKNIAPQKLENLLRDGKVVSNALVHCDKRPYVVALITVDRAAVAALRPELKDAPVSDQRIVDLVAADVASANANLARYEQVKYFRIVEREFSPDSGELTLTLKLKRRVIEANYRRELDAMYADHEREPAESPASTV